MGRAFCSLARDRAGKGPPVQRLRSAPDFVPEPAKVAGLRRARPVVHGGQPDLVEGPRPVGGAERRGDSLEGVRALDEDDTGPEPPYARDHVGRRGARALDEPDPPNVAVVVELRDVLSAPRDEEDAQRGPAT